MTFAHSDTEFTLYTRATCSGAEQHSERLRVNLTREQAARVAVALLRWLRPAEIAAAADDRGDLVADLVEQLLAGGREVPGLVLAEAIGAGVA